MEATYSRTFEDVLEEYAVFEPQAIIDYDNLIPDICDHFCEREINYSTPQAFIRKFNHKLRILAPNYNKMIASEMMKIDPLITEAITIDHVGTNDRSEFRSAHRDSKGAEDTETKNFGATRAEKNEAGNSSEGGRLSEVQAKLIQNLLSETQKTDNSKEYEESTAQYNKSDDISASNENVRTHETQKFDENVDASEDTTTKEVTNKTVDSTKDTTNKQTIADNQTGGDWTERGSDRRHGLTVNSDTPNAMLFNQPPNTAVYGTGRSHYEGQVTRDGVEDFPEAANIDAASYDMGSDDSPWFNYASAANNDIGHGTYDKSGTQTYQRSKTGDTSDKVVGNETTNQTVNGEKHVTGNKTTESTKDTDGTQDTTKNTTTNTSSDTTGSKGGVENSNSGTEKNSITDEKQDGLTKQTFANSATKQNVGVTVGTENRDMSANKIYKDKEHQNEEGKRRDEESEKTIRRGRSQRSPAKLLQEYRETLTYNAKMWLFGELNDCFLRVF